MKIARKNYISTSIQILIRFSILHYVYYLVFNLVPSELLSIKIEESKSNQILNWISIEVQFFAMYPSKFLIFVTSELLSAKTKGSKTN